MAFLAISLTCSHTSTIIWLFNEFISLTSKIDNIQELIFVDFVKYTVLWTISFTIVLLIHLCYPIYRNGYMYLLIHVLIDSMKKSLPPPKKNGVYIYVYMLLKCTTVIKCNFFQNQTKCFIHTFLNDHFNIYLKCTLLIINI